VDNESEFASIDDQLRSIPVGSTNEIKGFGMLTHPRGASYAAMRRARSRPDRLPRPTGGRRTIPRYRPSRRPSFARARGPRSCAHFDAIEIDRGGVETPDYAGSLPRALSSAGDQGG
jgi:hypothetical protein